MGRAKDGNRAKDGASLKREAERIVSDAATQKAAEADDRVRILRKELDAIKRQLRERAARTDLIIDAVRGVYSETPTITLPPASTGKERSGRETAVLHVSDIHVGKRTPEYDTATCRERMRLLAKKALEITRLRRTTAAIDELVILMGGDVIEGEGIFPGQPHEIDSDLLEQAVLAAPSILAELVVTLAAEFKSVRVVAVPGNHGRSDRHGSKRTNWDTVAYALAEHIIRQKVKNPDRMTWDQPSAREEDWYAMSRIEGWGNLLIHGHQVRGQLGFPWYGVGKKAAGWIDTIPTGWDYLWMGHFHTECRFALNHRTVLASGSSESRNVYARENLAASGFPSQRLAFFNRKHGLIVDCPIILSDERKPK